MHPELTRFAALGQTKSDCGQANTSKGGLLLENRGGMCGEVALSSTNIYTARLSRGLIMGLSSDCHSNCPCKKVRHMTPHRNSIPYLQWYGCSATDDVTLCLHTTCTARRNSANLIYAVFLGCTFKCYSSNLILRSSSYVARLLGIFPEGQEVKSHLVQVFHEILSTGLQISNEGRFVTDPLEIFQI